MAGAEFNSCDILQVLNQPFCRPHVEAVSQILWWNGQQLSQCLEELLVRSRRSTGWAVPSQPFDTALPISSPHDVDRCHTAIQTPSDDRLRFSRSALEDNERVSKLTGVTRPKPKLIHRVPLIRSQLPCCHDGLPGSNPVTAPRTIYTKTQNC